MSNIVYICVFIINIFDRIIFFLWKIIYSKKKSGSKMSFFPKQTCFPKSNLKSIFIMNSICNQILVFNSIWDSNWILNSVSLTEFSNIFDLIFDFTIEFGEAHRIAKQIRFDLRSGHRIRWASPNSSNKSTDKVAQLNRLWLNRLPTL